MAEVLICVRPEDGVADTSPDELPAFATNRLVAYRLRRSRFREKPVAALELHDKPKPPCQ